MRAAAQKISKRYLIARRRDDQILADAGGHQRRQRVVNHRLVVHGQQLLGDNLRDRIQPRAGATGQDDSSASHRIVHAGA